MNVASMGSGYQGQGIEAVLFNGSEVRHGADRQAEFNLPMFGSAVSGQLPVDSQAAVSLSPEALIVEHLQTVRYVARKIHKGLPQHVELDDLIAAGTVGLIDAANKYKADKNTQFKTYAQFRIRGAILDSLRTLDWSPRELRRKGRGVEEAIRQATQRLGRTPSDVEISGQMGISLAEYQELLSDLKTLEIGTLNSERNEDSGEEELAYVAAPGNEDPLFRCLEGEMKQHLAGAIDALPERERLVLTLYYYEELSMKEIAELLGVVESRVSQIRSSAVLRMRAELKAFAARPERKKKTARA